MFTYSSKTEWPLPCFTCGKTINRIDDGVPSTSGNMPDGATAFVSPGNYGSTVWDSCDVDQFLEINICDDCLKKATDRVAIVRTSHKAIEYSYEKFNPELDI